MPDIKDTVGEGGANLTHDVALVQAMLRVVKNAQGAPYLNSAYDGVYSPQTKDAITNFQIDNKLAPAPNAPNAPNAPIAPNPFQAPNAAPVLDKVAVVKVGSATFKKLVASLPADYSTMRIIENTKTVYLEMDAGVAIASQTKIGAHPDLMGIGFRNDVVRLVELMFKTHKLALTIAGRFGVHRTFQEQVNLEPNATKSGPGESYHNWGYAVDLGFNGIKWLAGDGTIVQDDWWFRKLEKVSLAKTVGFWKERDRLADSISQSLYRVGAWDQVHLQAFTGAKVSAGRSLVAILNNLGKTKWAHIVAKPNRYKSDLGLGGKQYDVGTSRQIWDLKATITKAMLAEAQSAALSAKLKKVVVVNEVDIKDTDLTDMRKTLKADLEAADTNWKKWAPVA
jgi:peptidoglycan hydrolase-like protein with peptidoglycan-binding domain